MPVIAVALALQSGITGANLAVVTICSAVPTASSAYVLARQSRRRAAIGADHHATDDSGGDHDADRDCAGFLGRLCARRLQPSSPGLVRAIQYSRDVSDQLDKPRRTGSPAFAEDDSRVCRRTL